ncbi:hypothetical protein C9J22_07105 [Photobacterium phosphoreum]|uniref:Lipoprotein n=1 Tax=Photobacterium phosphoreum TaxID=659 RepID=A0A2T3JUV4_PHOPO|nr:hypothetical protein [Photobacterium phosphoreum]PSU26224.1 hypothetical protein CTM96_06635 [Photobacterium phosphoreum]PSU44160.1 hypothetical protein CTM97_01525 [Photobacterium phosphoreum]PSU53000.1 hypothetical protein C9J18_06880 [Photobacterium phosphoreum]PSU71546.1 hypothetical protein C9J22_07105 [Photobacterium phosphoreum]
MKTTILVAIMYFSVLSGCSSSRHQQLVELGFERAYLDGYQDGCYSRSMAGKTYQDGFRRDPERSVVVKKYRSGWEDGFEHCYADDRDSYL